MSQDLLAPYRTQPSAPEAPESAQEKHRSVADGELATPWTLKDFFGSLNSVMRLPSKARRRAEPARTADGVSIAIPSVSPMLSKLILVGGGLTVLVLLVIRPLVLWATRAGHESLVQVTGVWEAGKGKHEGRHFELSDSAVVFHTGDEATDYTWHRVQEVRTRESGDSTLYTVRYEEGKATAELSFWYRYRPVKSIRLKNQPAVLWTLTKLRPVPGPPPESRPLR